MRPILGLIVLFATFENGEKMSEETAMITAVHGDKMVNVITEADGVHPGVEHRSIDLIEDGFSRERGWRYCEPRDFEIDEAAAAACETFTEHLKRDEPRRLYRSYAEMDGIEQEPWKDVARAVLKLGSDAAHGIAPEFSATA